MLLSYFMGGVFDKWYACGLRNCLCVGTGLKNKFVIVLWLKFA